MYNLFLDDIRMPSHAGDYMPPAVSHFYHTLNWVIVRNYKEFVDVITERGLPQLVSFDHDLADIHYDPRTWVEDFEYLEETGYDCAKWLVDYCIEKKAKFPSYLIHSMNPIGKQNILNYLRNYEKTYTVD